MLCYVGHVGYPLLTRSAMSIRCLSDARSLDHVGYPLFHACRQDFTQPARFARSLPPYRDPASCEGFADARTLVTTLVTLVMTSDISDARTLVMTSCRHKGRD